ncbi:type II secretion system protein GspC [Colwelliaceae bacterium 6441]
MEYPKNVAELNELLLKLPQAKVANAISVLLLFFIAYLFAQLTWLFISEKSSNSPTLVMESPVLINSKVSKVNINAIEQLNLFGKYSEQKVVQQVTVQDAPETKLNLTLSGTVASDDPEIAAAIIENNGKQETYGIGDKITGTRATLESVSSDRVLIKQSGRLETLMLDGFDYKQVTANRNNMAERESNPSAHRPLRQNIPQVLDQRDNEALSRTAMQLKKDINEDPGKITDYLKISPKREEGNIIGYQLMPGKNAEFFQSSGLKSGDIAIQMNGLDLTIPSEAAQALQALKEEQELSLLIDRNGEMTEILFSIQ